MELHYAGQSRFGRNDCPFHSPTSNKDAAAALIALLATPTRWPEDNLSFL